MRKKHLDEKIQIQANRLKQQTEEKLRRAKSNHIVDFMVECTMYSITTSLNTIKLIFTIWMP